MVTLYLRHLAQNCGYVVDAKEQKSGKKRPTLGLL